MSETAKHTPTPWSYIPETGTVHSPADFTRQVCRVHLADDLAFDTTGIEAEQDAIGHANGEFIVRACNAHAALVAALELMLAANPADRTPPSLYGVLEHERGRRTKIAAEDTALAALAIAKPTT